MISQVGLNLARALTLQLCNFHVVISIVYTWEFVQILLFSSLCTFCATDINYVKCKIATGKRYNTIEFDCNKEMNALVI